MRLEQVRRIVQAHHAELSALGVASLMVFGSVARHEQRSDSDVDMLVEFVQPTVNIAGDTGQSRSGQQDRIVDKGDQNIPRHQARADMPLEPTPDSPERPIPIQGMVRDKAQLTRYFDETVHERRDWASIDVTKIPIMRCTAKENKLP